MADKETVIVFCAHSDDQIFGPGGTLAKYAEEGRDIYTIIFSYGEAGGFWLKGNVAADIRKKETIAANKVIKAKGLAFLGLREGHFLEDAEKNGAKEKIRKLIEKHKPIMIFTHSDEDPLADHRAVCSIVLQTVDAMRYKGSVYAFDVWNPVPMRKHKVPKMYVDTKKYFPIKLRALKCFSSQWMSRWSLTWTLYFRDLMHGLESRYGLAERFYKLR